MDNNSLKETESHPESDETTGIDIGEKTTILVVIGVIISALIGVFLYSVETTITIPDTISIFNLINIFGPLLFSLLIALIYWQLYDVQKSEADILNQQKEIQSRQQRIEAQQNRPYVVVEDTHEMPDEGKVLVKASNFGPAPATNISLAVRVTEEDEQTVGARRLRRNEDGYSGYEGLGDFLRPDDEYIQFHAKHPDLNWLTFESPDRSSVVVKAGLEYTDIMDEEYFYPLQRSEVQPEESPTYTDISWQFVRHSDPP